MKQGSRDLFANCIRVTTPGNFHSCMLACSFGIGQFHGKRLRKSIGGQCPIVVYKSEKKQKMLGKSTTARLVCYLVSDWETNKISPNTSKETTKKKLAGTSTPTYFDDVKRDNWIDRITEGYDGDTYETADGIFPKRAEIFFSANYFSMDGIASSDGERTCDRLAFIPFGEMAQITAEELCRRQELFMKVVSNSHRPTELVIGELGNYIVSEEFKEDIKYFANWLSEKIQVIKSRTIVTNYSWAYAIHYKLFNIFESEWKKMCYSWESFEEWAETVHIPFLISQHIERDNAVNAIRRYFKGVLELIDGLSEAEVLKFCKIIKQKDRNAEFKYVLALHVDKRYSELQCMWSIKVTDVKTHLASVKGRWDNQTSAAFVKDTIHDLGEESVMDDLGTVTKRCMFVPMNVFPSADVQRFVQLTGQSEFMFLVENPEANQETEIDSRNSTQTQPNVPALQELEFDESSIHTNSLNEPDISDDLLDHYSTIKSVDNNLDGTENVPLCEDSVSVSSEDSCEDSVSSQSEDVLCSICQKSFIKIDDLISHMETHKKKNVKKITRAPRQVSMAQDVSQENDITQASPNFSKHSASQVDLVASQDPLMVNKSNMSNVTQISQSASKNSTFNSTTGGRKINMINNIYVCECGSSSTSFSGAQRHKCLKEKPLFKCPLCAKSCNNPGSLKLHISHKHKDTSATSAESTSMTVVEEQSTESTSMTVAEEQSTASKGGKPLHKCQYCSKVCKNAGGLQVHINSKHKEKVLPANSTEKNLVEVAETCSRKTKRRSIGNHKTKTSAKKN